MRSGLLVALGSVVALLAPSLAHAGPGLVVGAVEDDVRAATAVEAEARMAAFRLDGYPRSARDELLEAGSDESERRRADRSSKRERRRGAERRPGLRHGHEPGLGYDPSHCGCSRGLRLVRRGDRGWSPFAHARDRRQRAEPESLLASPVQSRRIERGTRCLPGAPCPDVRRDQGSVTRGARLRGRGVAARDRPSGRRPPDAFADDVHPGHGSCVSRERACEAGDGRALDPRLRRQLERRADGRATR